MSDLQVNGHLRYKRASEVHFLEDEKLTAYYNILILGISLQECSFFVRWGRGLTKVSVGAGARKPPEILPEGLDGGMGVGGSVDCGSYYGYLSNSSLFVTSAKPGGVIGP